MLAMLVTFGVAYFETRGTYIFVVSPDELHD